MQKLCVDLSQLNPAETDRAIESLLCYLRGEPSEICLELCGRPVRFLRLGSHTMLSPDMILYITAEGHYCRIRTRIGTWRVRMTFHEISGLLPSGEFLSCNRGIQLHLSEIRCREGSSFRMTDGALFPISGKHKKEIIQQYEHYLVLHA